MDTGINVQVVASQPRGAIEPAVQRALAWFDTVERICTRFDSRSEVMQLIPRAGQAVRVSTLLFEAVGFAIDLAEQTDGAFDPTVGASLEQLGFNINYRTGEAIHSGLDASGVTFRDVQLNRSAQTILLQRPLILDLNAVAKGLAIDLASRELHAYADTSVEAGGDVYVRGLNPAGEAWHIGIQHPRAAGLLAHTLHVTNTAVCTSGDYERRSASGEGHLLDARTGRPVTDLASVTVVAPTAMAADGLSTAAMALGRDQGLRFLEAQNVSGVLIAPDGESFTANL
jgi:thiamine biosynthesis lipoprotein